MPDRPYILDRIDTVRSDGRQGHSSRHPVAAPYEVESRSRHRSDTHDRDDPELYRKARRSARDVDVVDERSERDIDDPGEDQDVPIEEHEEELMDPSQDITQVEDNSGNESLDCEEQPEDSMDSLQGSTLAEDQESSAAIMKNSHDAVPENGDDIDGNGPKEEPEASMEIYPHDSASNIGDSENEYDAELEQAKNDFESGDENGEQVSGDESDFRDEEYSDRGDDREDDREIEKTQVLQVEWSQLVGKICDMASNLLTKHPTASPENVRQHIGKFQNEYEEWSHKDIDREEFSTFAEWTNSVTEHNMLIMRKLKDLFEQSVGGMFCIGESGTSE
ncbi:unnamed protein product [Periconia digitata]|uniref:Uncharacterized protein n=1 Tax=Periconia digitata TaxID=1303443 RepID=A0A9W4U792_9PLEO|nr:unnamed protein product [Periconia digitata]